MPHMRPLATERWNEANQHLEELKNYFEGAQNLPRYRNLLWGIVASGFQERYGREGVYVALNRLRKEGLPDDIYEMLKGAVDGCPAEQTEM